MKIKLLLKLLTLAIITCSSCSKGLNEQPENLNQEVQKKIHITLQKGNNAFYASGTNFLVKSLHLFEFTRAGELFYSFSPTDFERIKYSSPLSDGLFVIIPNLTESQINQQIKLTYADMIANIPTITKLYWCGSFSAIEPIFNIIPMTVSISDSPEF